MKSEDKQVCKHYMLIGGWRNAGRGKLWRNCRACKGRPGSGIGDCAIQIGGCFGCEPFWWRCAVCELAVLHKQ